jgi:hypothetical protein
VSVFKLILLLRRNLMSLPVPFDLASDFLEIRPCKEFRPSHVRPAIEHAPGQIYSGPSNRSDDIRC